MAKYGRSRHMKAIYKKASRGAGGRFCKTPLSSSVSFVSEIPEAPAHPDTHTFVPTFPVPRQWSEFQRFVCNRRQRLAQNNLRDAPHALSSSEVPYNLRDAPLRQAQKSAHSSDPAHAPRSAVDMTDAEQLYLTWVAENILPSGFRNEFTAFYKVLDTAVQRSYRSSSKVDDVFSSGGPAQGPEATGRG